VIRTKEDLKKDLSKVKRSAKQEYDIDLDMRQNWSFFVNKSGEFELNAVCSKCEYKKECGQSFNAKIEWCKKNGYSKKLKNK
jgi:hypothetical protein